MTRGGRILTMRKLIMWNMVTLDGFFEGPKSWDIDWHEYVWGDELEQLSIDQSKSIGILLFGRVTYQGMASYWSTAHGEIADFMNSVPKIVLSTTLERAEWKNTRLVKENAAKEVARLKQEPGKDLFIIGSANLSSTLMRDALIDEDRLGRTPVILAEGHPLSKLSEELVKAGVMLAGEGLRPSSKGVRVRFSGGKHTVIDGPFTETKELVAGFWLWQVKSKQEAIEWLKRAPFGGGTEIEIRQVFEADDFGPQLTPELRAQDDRVRAQAAKRAKP